jgi:hypothetical protein
MNQINFSHDWNCKLTSSGKIFTTIRKKTTQKAAYYGSRIGQKFEIVLKGKVIGSAILRAIQGRKFSDLDLSLLMLDTGYTDLESIFKLFTRFGIEDEDTVMILLFEKLSSLV